MSFIQPHQTVTLLGVVFVGPSFRTFPSPGGFPPCSHSFPHSIRSLQLLLRDHWDFVVESVVFTWAPEIELYLLWWSDARYLLASLYLLSPLPDLLFWSASSGLGDRPSRPLCLGSLAGHGAALLHQPARALGH